MTHSSFTPKSLLLASRAQCPCQQAQEASKEGSALGTQSYLSVAAHFVPFARVLGRTLATTAIRAALVCSALFTRYEGLLVDVTAAAVYGGPHGVGRVLVATYCAVYAALLICDRGMRSERRKTRRERARRAQ